MDTGKDNTLSRGFQRFVNFTSEKHILLLCILAGIYRILLDLQYVYAVYPRSEYLGLTLDPNWIKYAVSWLLYAGLIWISPKREDSAAAFFYHMQMTVIIAPMLSYYALNDQNSVFMVFVAIVMGLQALILRPQKKAVSVRLRFPGFRPYVTVMLTLLVVITFVVTLLQNSFQGLKAFDFGYLNAMRKNLTIPTIVGYLNLWSYTVILPFFMILSLEKRKWLLALLCIVGDIVFYMVLGSKTIYLSLLVVLGVYVVYKLRMPIKGVYLGLSAVVLVTAGLYVLSSIRGMESGIVDAGNFLVGVRMLFFPAHNKFEYYAFFSQYPKLWFADGQIGRFFGLTYPYTGTSGLLINAYLYGSYASNSLTGYLGDGYAQAGFVGVAVFSIILTYVIRFFDKYSHSNIAAPLFCVLAYAGVWLTDLTLLTWLLSGGGLLIMVLVMLYYQPNGEKEFWRNAL